MDTIQALPLADMLPSLVPQAPQELAGKDLKNAAFSKVFRAASERTASAEGSPENVIAALAPMTPASAAEIPTSDLAPGSVARSGKVWPLEALGLAAHSLFTDPRGGGAKAYGLEAIAKAHANGPENVVLSTERMMPISPPFSPNALAGGQAPPGLIHLANAHASNAQVSSTQAPHLLANPPNAETAGPEPSDFVQNLRGTDGIDTELTSAVGFRADTLRTVGQPMDARRARIDTSASTIEPALSSLGSVSPTVPASAGPATSPASPINIVMQPGAPLLDSLGEKIIWLTRQEHQQATLQLRPAELGALEIRVSITNATSAQIEIHAQQSDTGELIESMLPKLQQALEQQGLKLDDVRMSQQSLFSDARSAQQQANSRDPSSHPANAEGHAEVEDEIGDDALISSLPKDSAIDTYA